MRHAKVILRSVLVAVSAGLLLAVPAAHADHTPVAELRLRVEARDGDTTEVTLTCSPDGGSHPRAEAACDALWQAHGQFGDLAATAGPCTMELRPTLGEATGHWRGEPVHFRHTYDNPCLAARESGGVLTPEG